MMSVFVLQVIAMVTMLSDHLASTFFDNSIPMRSIGRFAFPIYAFLLAEGFRHYKHDPNRVSRHMGTFVILTIVSEFCYDLLECKPLTISSMLESQSVMVTLTLALLGLIAIDKWKDQPVFMWSAILLTALMNFMTMSNYKFVGVLLVYAFYYYLNHSEGKNYLFRFLSIVLIFALYIPVYHWARYNFCSLTDFAEKLTTANICWYTTHIAIAACLAAYNGKLGYHGKGFKIVYKWFYPAHLLILGIIYQLM